VSCVELISLFYGSPLKYFPSISVLFFLSIMYFLLTIVLYWLSLSVQWQFGELIKSMYDAYRSKIDQDILEVLDEIIQLTDNPLLGIRPRREKRDIVWRYLNYYRIICPICNSRLSPSAMKAHMNQEQIKIAQQQLRGAGFDPGRIDGILSPQTQEGSVANFHLSRFGV
jgi:hypothetical protein